jgi:hypothetical protein
MADGNILASMRSVSAVVIIEKSTGDIIWHLDSTVVAQQHCANELPNGNILVSFLAVFAPLPTVLVRYK